MRLNPVLDELGSYPIAVVRQRAAAREAAGLPVIDFSIGDPLEPTPEFIAEALRQGVPEVSQYPTSEGEPHLRAAIAEYVQRRHGVSVNPDTQVIPTSGSKEAIFSTHFAFVDRDAADVVAYPSPGYPVYERGARFAGAELHPIVLDEDFVMRSSRVPDQVWDRARILWICTPHNPSGAVMSRNDLVDLYNASRDSATLLFSDECYADTYEDDVFPNGPASVLQIAEHAEGVLAFLSLSKRSGMTGYRSGAIVGDETAIAALKTLRATTGTAPSSFVQAAATAAWSDDDHAAERREVFTEKRRVLGSAFKRLGLDVVASQAGLYLWVRVDDDLRVTERLLQEGIVVSPGRYFGEGGEGYIRLALVPHLEECAAAAEALVEALG
jgi:LL-diaminopimelate aminotransferase